MSASATPERHLRERILTTLRGSDKPLTFNALAKRLKAKPEPLRKELESIIDSKQIYRWPGRSPLVWHFSPEEKAREAILTAAATQALSKSELCKAAAKSLRALPANRLESFVPPLLAEKQLQPVPALAGRSNLYVRTGDRAAYFNAARAFLVSKITKAGFDSSEFFGSPSLWAVEQPPTAKLDAAALILEAVQSLEPVRGVPVSALRLRNHLPDLTKAVFDAAALALREKQAVFLSQHADTYNLSQEDKSLLIDGQDGTYYVAIAIR